MTERQAGVRPIVVGLIKEQIGRSGTDDELDDDLDILGTGLIDSLAFVDLLINVETQLEAPLALDRLDFEQIDSLGALIDALDELTESR
ncbi:phosphopantetheine-binding protein [Ilumatobacter sp.]|uniref:phosphopantetheine-binding protein n=1 Tax=Ilumatobacter sp. TaxID=1967498 RepID=UPI003AF59D1A